jgi:hypothetical protein
MKLVAVVINLEPRLPFRLASAAEVHLIAPPQT